MINPSFEGYCKDIPLIICKGIVSANNLTFNDTRQISTSNVTDERHVFAKLRTTNYQVTSLVISEFLYSGACDGRCGIDCYRFKTSNSSNIAIGLHFVLE